MLRKDNLLSNVMERRLCKYGAINTLPEDNVAVVSFIRARGCRMRVREILLVCPPSKYVELIVSIRIP